MDYYIENTTLLRMNEGMENMHCSGCGVFSAEEIQAEGISGSVPASGL